MTFSPVSSREPQLGSLQIDQNGDRPPHIGFYRPYGLHQGGEMGVIGMAHIDAEHVRARDEEGTDLFLSVAGRPQRGHNLGFAAASHR